MAILDRNIYDASEIDWQNLNLLAKRAATETLLPHSAKDGWRLTSRMWFRKEDYNDGQGSYEEHFENYYYCLHNDGHLYKETDSSTDIISGAPLSYRCKNGTSTRPFTDGDVMCFDFKSIYDSYSNGQYSGHTTIFNIYDKKNELLFSKKGEGLTKQLMDIFKKNVIHYTKLANEGDIVAQRRLGECYSLGEGVVQDYKLAFEWYIKTAHQGNAQDQYQVGECYSLGKGVTKDYKTAVEWYTKSANQGNSVAQYKLGECYYLGQGVAKDYKTAIEWYTKSANQGNSVAQNLLGNFYLSGEFLYQDIEEAIAWYKKAVSTGNADAQNALGDCYSKGIGVSEDYKMALDLYIKSANQGNAEAQYKLGKCYYIGKGVTKDYKTAVEWYQKSANQGNADAQTDLNNIYAELIASKKEQYNITSDDMIPIVDAAVEGDSTAQYNLGNGYFYGKGLIQSYTDAFEWYQKSANQGNADAQCSLGDCYCDGKGAKPDHIIAKKWYTKSANQWNETAQIKLDQLINLKKEQYNINSDDIIPTVDAAIEGDSKAQFKLGNGYFYGKGLTQSYKDAIEWYTLSANQGNSDAQNALGDCYSKGIEVLKDNKKAFEWYALSANQGNQYAKDLLYKEKKKQYNITSDDIIPTVDAAVEGDSKAQFKLGNGYFHGKGLTQSYKDAIEWYALSANQGNSDAQNALGDCYSQGIEVLKDNKKAFEWYALSANQGNQYAKDLLHKKEKKQKKIAVGVFVAVVLIFSVWLFFTLFIAENGIGFNAQIFLPSYIDLKKTFVQVLNLLGYSLYPAFLYVPIAVVAMSIIDKYIILKYSKIRWWIYAVPYFWAFIAIVSILYIINTTVFKEANFSVSVFVFFFFITGFLLLFIWCFLVIAIATKLLNRFSADKQWGNISDDAIAGGWLISAISFPFCTILAVLTETISSSIPLAAFIIINIVGWLTRKIE